MPRTPSPKTSYETAIAHLNSLFPELFSIPGQPRRKFSLKEIGLLCAALGLPQHQFPSVLVAGTNGKGSTSATLAAIACESSLRVGLYTSPHLDRINERIRILAPNSSAQDLPDDAFARLYFRVHDAAQQLVLDATLSALPSFFELLTALAFLYFAESKVDLAILEVGMGGRLDATNIVNPILSVITDVSLDHQEWLGTTIDLIAREKAGILRPNGVLVILPQLPDANQAIGEIATALKVRAINAALYMPPFSTGPLRPYPLEVLGTQILIDSPLKGAHQHRNLALAIASAVELASSNTFSITPASIERGIRTTHWPGRLEKIQLPEMPEIILDVAHNPAGAWALRAALNADSETWAGTRSMATPSLSHPHRDKGSSDPSSKGQVLIFACLRDKPLREMTQILFPIFEHVVLAPIHSPRATEVAELIAAAQRTGTPSTVAATVTEAIHLALTLKPSRIVVSGSLYLVGEARTLLLNSQQGSFRET